MGTHKFKQKVYVGVSGGIDSAASLFMLKEMGYDVTGVFLFMRGEAISELVQLQLNEVSRRTGVEIVIYDVRERFKKLILEPFIASYLCGDTPSPCADCNPLIKWYSLLKFADEHGGGYIATGHYCRVVIQNDLYYLTKGVDTLKDQSYYMWRLSQEILCRALFPLGDKTKVQVREYMQQKEWREITNKAESMGVCFLDGLNYGKWLRQNSSSVAAIVSGNVVNRKGEIIGRHSGYPFYTLAQKKGFSITNGEKGLSVVAIDMENNVLVVGDKNELMSSVLFLRDWRFTLFDEVVMEKELVVKVRGVGFNPNGYCTVQVEGDLLKVILLDDKAWAVTKGQPAVFYIGDRLVGGGIVI